MLITDEKEFDQWIEKAEQEFLLALDTEFLREKTYFPKLCLLQCATNDSKVALCPFALDLKKLRPLLHDPKRTVIFHSSSQDLEIIQQELGVLPATLFDTQVAASFLGFGDQIAYAALVDKVYAKKLDKSYTRFDWSTRPLPEKAMSYALNDVRFLIPLYHNLSKKLEAKGRVQWNLEECLRLLQEAEKNVDNSNVWKKVKGLKRLKGKKLVWGQRLAEVREYYAQKKNRPRKWVLSDDLILDIVTFVPKSLANLKKMKRFPENSNALAKEVFEQLNLPIVTKTRSEVIYYTQKQQILADYYMAFVRKIADDANISTPLLLHKSDLLNWCAGQENVPFMQGWRKELIGEKLQSLADGAALKVKDGDLHLVSK